MKIRLFLVEVLTSLLFQILLHYSFGCGLQPYFISCKVTKEELFKTYPRTKNTEMGIAFKLRRGKAEFSFFTTMNTTSNVNCYTLKKGVRCFYFYVSYKHTHVKSMKIEYIDVFRTSR
jgi:hypothetical protein